MKRGYAVSGMLYTILVLFMALLLSFLYTMQNKKNILDKLKTEVVEAFYCSKADNIEDLRGATVVATSVTGEGDNALIQLPKEGRYDTTSYLSVPIETIKNNVSNLKSGISFDYTFSNVKTFNYTNSSVSFSTTVGKIYEIISLGYQGTQTLSFSNFTGCEVIKNISSSAGGSGLAIAFVKATSNTITLSSTASNNIGFVLESSENSISGIDELSTVTKITGNPSKIDIEASPNQQCLVLAVGYQGSQSQYIGLKDNVTPISLSNTPGYNNYGLSQAIVRAASDFELVTSVSNSFIYVVK